MSAKAMRKIRLDRNDVYNGMTGISKRFDGEFVEVDFLLGANIETRGYLPEELSYYLEPAYAMTVHKAQGGQAKYVVLVMGSSFANRSLIYTALTRCSSGGKIFIVTTPDFNEHRYAAENWEDLSLDDGFDSLPASKCLSKFQYRVEQCIKRKQIVFV